MDIELPYCQLPNSPQFTEVVANAIISLAILLPVNPKKNEAKRGIARIWLASSPKHSKESRILTALTQYLELI
jgi:hypothetical protein